MSLAHVFFIDARVVDPQTLIANLPEGSQWFILDEVEDGLQQMARLLAPFQQLQSIQILSHAAPGSVQLGGSLLDQQSLQAQSLLLQQIGSHLNSDGDLLLYGCNLAGNQQGELLLETLAQLTQADVAASTDLTGTGGDWTLEWRSGELQSASLDAPHYLHNLAVIEDDDPFANNYIYGSEANETIIGGLGSDVLWGREGNDLLAAQYEDDTSETMGNGLYGQDGDDTLLGADGDDSLYGGDGNDSLIGGSGNDLLSAWNGNDTLHGGDGDDRLEFSNGNFMATGGSGRDTFVITMDLLDLTYSELPPPVITISDFTVGPEGDRLDLSQLLAQLSIAEQDNPFAESNQSLRLQQQDNDVLLQWLNPYTSNWSTAIVLSNLDLSSTPLTIDNFIPPLSPDGSNHGLQLSGGQYTDILNGSRGNDLLVGNGGRDLLDAGYGDDTLRGGDGATQDDSHGNLLYGGGGNDLLIAGNNGDKLNADRIGSGSATYNLAGNDTLVGGDGNDTLVSALGSDVMTGGAGDDEFQWSPDSQATMTGGAGHDTYILPAAYWGNMPSVVTDFVSGPGGDKLDISNILRNISPPPGNPFNPDNPLLRLIQEGEDALLQFKDGNSNWHTLLTLQDLDLSATPLTRENFVPDLPLDGSNIGYSLSGTESADTLTGSFVDDHLSGQAGNDLLLGKQGNDFLDGGSGADTLKGGAGSDIYVIDNVGDVIDESDELYGDARWGETNTVISSITYTAPSYIGITTIELSGSANINARGGEDTQSITGNSGNNRLSNSNTLDSILNGGQGADTLVGIAWAANTYVVDNIGDQIIDEYDDGYGDNGFRDTVQASLNWTLSTVVDDLQLTGSNAINGTGNANANRITGNAAANVLNGAGGADTLIGGLGNDLYLVDSNTDVIQETSTVTGEADSVWSAVGWTLGNNLENLLLTGSAAINGTGNAQNNKLSGNAANNVLNGAAGADTLNGGLGNDTYVVDNAGDVIQETSTLATEIDSVQSSISWTLGNNLENLLLTGTAAINGTGNGLNNKLTGNAANNVLNGAAGADTLNGGLGNDTYVVDNAGDVIQETSTLATEIDSVQSSISWTLGNNLENLLLTGSAAINGTGNGLNNKLTGNAANNVLNGATGTDTLNGGLGNDTYVVDNAGDVIQETSTLAAEIDSVQSSISWTLGNNLENLLLTGSVAINGTGNALNNTLTGNTANNVLNGATGTDTLIGGLGNDTYVVDNAGDVIQETSTLATEIDSVQASLNWTLGNNLENLLLTGSAAINGTGNALNNTLTGNTGANVLYGAAGADTLNGAVGADTLNGGLGNDTYVVDNAGDLIQETSTLATEIDSVQASLSWTLGNNLENLLLAGGAVINGNGNALNNTLTGNTAANILNGSGGADTLIGGLGDDTYVVDNAGDLIQEISTLATEIDSVQASLSWTLGNNLENLLLTGDAAINGTGNALNNTLTGNAAANVLYGAAGNDTLDGAGGADTLIGGLGDDTYVVDNVGDVIQETSTLTTEIDSVQASLSWTLGNNLEYLELTGSANINGYGNTQNNMIKGNMADNQLNGDAGNDLLLGGSGDDTLIGGSGSDQLFGGIGADRFSFLALSDLGLGDSSDAIFQFKTMEGDKIDLSALDAVLASTGTNEAFTFIGSAAFSATNASAQLRFSDGVLYGSVNADSAAEFEIRLVGVASLQSSDFIL